MKIVVNNFSPINYALRLEIVQEYCKKFESEKYNKDSFWLSDQTEHIITVTGKYPEVITVRHSNYHVKCRKTRTTYVFDIWKAV